MATWPTIPSNELSLYRHYCSSDGAFDPRDPLVHTILSECSTVNYIICLLYPAQHCALVDWIVAMKFKPRKSIPGALSDFSQKLHAIQYGI